MNLARSIVAVLALVAAASAGCAQEPASAGPPSTGPLAAPPSQAAPDLGNPPTSPAAPSDPFGAPATDPFGGAAPPGAGSPFGNSEWTVDPFGGGPFLPGAGAPPPGAAPSPRFVASGAIIITWSEKGDVAWGFSKTTGRWSKQKLDPPASVAPELGGNLATIRGGSKVYAYSGQTGRWDVLGLPEGHNPQVAVHSDFVLVNDGQDIYTFAGSTGRWTSPSGEEVSETAAGPPAADDMIGGFPSDSVPAPQIIPSDSSLADLREKYKALDQQADQLAAQYRTEAETKGPQHPEMQSLKRRLSETVTQAFQARQQLHQAELAEFQRRMRDIQETIESRSRMQNQIVERRVAELLNPSLQWEPLAQAPGDSLAKQPATTLTPTPETTTSGTAAGRDASGYGGDRRASTVQIQFREPEGAVIESPNEEQFQIPARMDVRAGLHYRFTLTSLPGRPNLRLLGSLYPISGIRDPVARSFVTLNAIPVNIAAEDLDQASSGNLVVKLIYLSAWAPGQPPTVETLSSTRLDPGADIIAEGQRRGEILAILQLGNREEDVAGWKSSEEGEQPETVGVIFQSQGNQIVSIALEKAGGARIGEELLVTRENTETTPPTRSLVARVRILAAKPDEAVARVVNRVQDDILPGDQVMRDRRELEKTAASESRLDSARVQSANNLKQLMLALHNYHDTYRRFPPAVILGKDGKGGPPHSWRVELLPFLDRDDLYKAYRFDEPWDSETNKLVLAKMPDVFRSPLDKPDSTNASYFGLVTPLAAIGARDASAKGFDAGGADAGFAGAAGGVLAPLGDAPAIGPATTNAPPAGEPPSGGPPAGAGPSSDTPPGAASATVYVDWHRGTLFSRPEGTRIQDITDGTSNTVALVEAKRNIPWTRPQDIAYVADQALPVLGGWFPDGWHAGFADGSVQFISNETDEETLRWFFTIGAGEPTSRERLKTTTP